jgi:hypothetical protein
MKNRKSDEMYNAATPHHACAIPRTFKNKIIYRFNTSKIINHSTVSFTFELEI